MNVYEYLSRATPQKGSKLAPYSHDIRVLLEHGRTYQAIVNFLSEAHKVTVTRQSLREFCLRHFPEETAALASGVRRPSTHSPSQPAVVATTSVDKASPPPPRAAVETRGTMRPSPELASPANVPQAQARARTEVEPQSSQSDLPALNAAPETPAFQPDPPTSVPNIEHTGPKQGTAKNLLALLSMPCIPRGPTAGSETLDDLSEEIRASHRRQRREQQR